MGYAENRGTYWRGRYKIAPGRYGTVKDEGGATRRFEKKRDAEQAADAEEVKIRGGGWRDPTNGKITFGAFASRWYSSLSLAASTMQNYRRHIEEHLLPEFENRSMDSITSTDVDAWEKKERAAGYAASSVRTWRSTLHLIFADAVDEGRILANPATKRRGRGRRAGRSRHRGPEKTVTSPLGILLIAERAALLAGRDDEFVACVLAGYTGMRWGEFVGLETEFARATAVRIEWQLYELDTGELVRCPPKDDSYRTIDVPDWLSTLVSEHVRRTSPPPCSCHGKAYVFRGRATVRGGRAGAKLADVAGRAGVSTGTVSTALNWPERVAESTRLRIEQAIADLGYVRGGVAADLAAHWSRSGFGTWLFAPAASGWYPKRAREPHPVPLLAEPWPGVPLRGRQADQRAEACWAPIARGLTPHGLRHSHRTLMEELRTEKVLMDERMGHIDGSVSARYAHVTPSMRRRLLDELTEAWTESLNVRRAMHPRSPVAVLDALLTKERSAGGGSP